MPAHKRRTRTPTRPERITPDTIVDHDRDITAAERIVQLIGIGTHLDHAGAAVGLAPPEVRHWMRTGIAVLTQDTAGRDWDTFTYEERALATFAHAAITAEGNWIGTQQTVLEQLARGGITTDTITEQYDAVGNLLTRTTRTTATLPDARVIQWRLERRYPNVYGARATIDVIGADTSNEPDTRERLRSRLLQLAERLALNPGEEPPE